MRARRASTEAVEAYTPSGGRATLTQWGTASCDVDKRAISEPSDVGPKAITRAMEQIVENLKSRATTQVEWLD